MSSTHTVDPGPRATPSVYAGLAGKVALITGATSGIGRAVAVALAGAGAKVVFSGRREAEGAQTQNAIEAVGGSGSFVRADVAIEEQLQSVVTRALSLYGRLDLAFNNAGVDILGPLPEVSAADYRHLFDTNFWGVMAAMKHEIAAMLQTGGGAIVNTSSIAGHVGAPNFSLYAASKHAVEGLTRTAALEFARKGIRVNSIAPAFIGTPMLDRLTGGSDGHRESIASQIPMGRIGKLEEAAAAVLFLLSDSASFITGDCLRIDGGWLAQ